VVPASEVLKVRGARPVLGLRAQHGLKIKSLVVRRHRRSECLRCRLAVVKFSLCLASLLEFFIITLTISL
jgi:hypothetical protein